MITAYPAEPQVMWGGMLRIDQAGFLFHCIFLVGAFLTILLAMESERFGSKAEFYILLLISTLGLSLMASAADMIMLYLAMETATLPLFILAGFMNLEKKAVEAGLKYLLFGAGTSAVMLYGFSLLYGFSGQTQIAGLGAALVGAGNLPFVIGILLVVVGFGFKLAAVPFHFWSPDVYEGAPSIVAGFLSTASKAAGFIVLLRFMGAFLPVQVATWTTIAMVLAALSMTAGNLLALAQKNFKRMLAYSSIAQAGYILVGVAGGWQLGASAVAYYLAVYLFANIAAFAISFLVSPPLGGGRGRSSLRSRRHRLLARAASTQSGSGAGLVGQPLIAGRHPALRRIRGQAAGLQRRRAGQPGLAGRVGRGECGGGVVLLFDGVTGGIFPPGGRGREDQAAGVGDGRVGDLRDRDHRDGGDRCAIIGLGGSGSGSGSYYP